MGKRKERRLAAKMAANRRVKLDIFADPCGDTVGTSAHEVGGDTDQEHRAVVPTSPSSSGQGQENPLLLLGQYSDDELEEETSKQPKVDADGSSSDVPDPDAEEPAEDFGGTEKDINDDKQLLEQVNTVENVDSHDGKEDESTYGTAEYSETDPVTQVNVPEPSGIEVNGDLTGGWKVVMHEESNQYYYWNTVTGETSWEVPTVLAGLTVSGGEGNVSHIDAHLSSESAMDAYASVVDGLGGRHVSTAEAIVCNNSSEIENENGELAYIGYDANQALTHYSDSAASISNANPSVLSNFGSSLQANAVSMGQLTAPVAEDRSSNDEEDKDKLIKNSIDCYGTTDVHSSHLVKCCESLLQRLEVLNRSGGCLEGHEWITKEIEVRLSDCKALSPYGSSLLPFWWHTEGQLKQLESAVSKGEASLIVPDKHNDKLEAIQNSPLQCIETSSEIIENEKGITSSVKISYWSRITESSMLQIEATSRIPDTENAKTEGIPSARHEHLGCEQEPDSFPEAKPNTTSVVPEGESHADEDIDMDVEMEVDEEPVNPCTTDSPSTLEKLDQSNQPVTEYPPLPRDEPCVPPPDEEWIPPPPPDDEPIPPPPPEEPPLPLVVPPAYPDTLLCPPFLDQYNIGYTAPAYEFYSSLAGSTGGNYYAQAEGSQISEPQAPPYYDPAGTNALHEVAVDVNPVEAAAYNDVLNGAIPSGPVVSSVLSSGYYVEAGPFSYLGSVPTSDHSGPVGYAMETGNIVNNVSLLSKVNPELKVPSTVTVPQVGTLQVSFVASSTQSGGSAFSNGSAVDPLPAASSNNQAKAAVRRKKHTVAVASSLRSNKKVSSLVDKWKAAKEELHSEEDEEPESALELLEMKRRKEIEEWRAQQIASGEAQDNANFLPLGGDWRERVKRKRAKAKTEAAQTPTEAVDNENQQPDLVELSKDLPSGWQAFWDESSEGVYYGNSITSETTWTRPTR